MQKLFCSFLHRPWSSISFYNFIREAGSTPCIQDSTIQFFLAA